MEPTSDKQLVNIYNTSHENKSYILVHFAGESHNVTHERIHGNHQPLVILRIVSSILLCFSLLLVVFFGILLYRFRTRKVIKASSPLLLNLVLLGAMLQYIYCFVEMMSQHRPVVSCIVSQWLQLTGFTLLYGALGLKTWRVSVILLFYKSRQLYTKDQALVVRLLALLGVVFLYLLVWTFISLQKSYVHTTLCSVSTWGQFVTYCGKLILLLWCCLMCYQARFAPTLYNDSTYLGLACWNNVVWLVNFLLSRYYLQTYHSDFWNFFLKFLYTECTVSTTLVLIFIPKFAAIFSKTRIVEGTLTDVYGPSRVHKLTLVINKTGSVRTISCSPCGPLQDVSETTEHTETSDIRETRETEYSKEEVNALIELVSKLKSERQYYKSQLKTLISDLHSLKSDAGGRELQWPPTPYVPQTPCVAETKENNKQYTNGFSPKSYWVANFLNGHTGDITPSAGLLSCQQSAATNNVIGRSRTGDSVNTIITTVSLSPNINMAETNLALYNNNNKQEGHQSERTGIKTETNNNSPLNAFEDSDLWSKQNDTGYNDSGQPPLTLSNNGSNICCINKPDIPLNMPPKAVNKAPQRPNTLTIAKKNQHDSSNCYTKRTHFVFYI